MADTKIEIPSSKKKLIQHLITSVIFMSAGFWFLLYNPQTSNPIFNNPVIKNSAAILAIILGLLGIYFFSKKLRDKRPGLIMTETFFIDNSSGISTGEVLWSDVKEIKTIKVFSQKFITVLLKNPDEYISRQTNSFKRKTMSLNFKSYGSPVHITANGLKIDFDELEKLFRQKLYAAVGTH